MINPALFSSASPEHYTPKHILDAAIACMGGIDLDPCSNSHENPNVQSKRHYTMADDGLKMAWKAKSVWLNPPFSVLKFNKDGSPSLGKPKIVEGIEVRKQIMSPVIYFWIKKLVNSFIYGDIQQAIALIPARTDTEWFSLLNDYPVCFVKGRLRFSDAENFAPFPTALIALGISSNKFATHFEHIGRIYSPVTPF